jgi:hypothetical protein
MKDAKVRRKEKMEKRIAEIKTDYQARVEKLKQAGKLINEAFAPKEEEHLV